MIPRNCLTAVLDRLVKQGGYACFRGSDHSTWGMHALHVSPEGLAHYTPGATLDKPSDALMGFDGIWWDRELADAKPVPVRAIVVSAWIFALGATAWAIGRMLKR
jgi:hypothetical protein